MEKKKAVKLSRGAYEVMKDGEEYEPFVNTQESVFEFSFKSVLFGVFFGESLKHKSYFFKSLFISLSFNQTKNNIVAELMHIEGTKSNV